MLRNLTIVGLGPAGLAGITLGALEAIRESPRVLLRTGRHPAAQELAEMGIHFTTFDGLYDRLGEFGEIYAAIAEAVVADAGKGPLVYAVPGHPLVGEESVRLIIELAKGSDISFEILPAMSFVDPVLTCLETELSQGLRIIDGLQLSQEQASPGSRPDPRVPNLVMQVYSPQVASHIKLSLMDYYPDEHMVKVIKGAGIPGLQQVAEIPLFELDRLGWIDHLTCVYLPPLGNSAAMVSRYPLDRITDIMELLRGADGCPWDLEQTHQSLKKYMVEETYEVLEAIDEGNMYKLCEELGDLLLQITFHAQIARESGFFDFNDVIRVISEKLVRRHPHIFGDVSVQNSREVSANWEEIKKGELREKGEIRQSVLDGIPQSMPALMKADKIQRKAAKVGFDWPDYKGALEKVVEETREIEEAIARKNQARIADEIGDLLFSAVNLARLLNIDAEDALIMAVGKFKQRFALVERLAAEAGQDLGKMDLPALDSLWEEAKKKLKTHGTARKK